MVAGQGMVAGQDIVTGQGRRWWQEGYSGRAEQGRVI
jgi:hypothetical protein